MFTSSRKAFVRSPLIPQSLTKWRIIISFHAPFGDDEWLDDAGWRRIGGSVCAKALGVVIFFLGCVINQAQVVAARERSRASIQKLCLHANFSPVADYSYKVEQKGAFSASFVNKCSSVLSVMFLKSESSNNKPHFASLSVFSSRWKGKKRANSWGSEIPVSKYF